LLKYRLRLSGFDLPEPVERAQQDFDEDMAKVLEGMADRMAGKVAERKDNLEHSFDRLEQTIRSCCSEGSQELLTAKLQTFLALCRNIESVTVSLDKEI
jgi:multidrug resistance protein MdtO